MSDPFCNRDTAAGMGVAVPGVPEPDVGIARGESSAIQKLMVSASDWTLSMGFFASRIFLLVLLSANVTDMALEEARLPPTGTSSCQQGHNGRSISLTQ